MPKKKKLLDVDRQLYVSRLVLPDVWGSIYAHGHQ